MKTKLLIGLLFSLLVSSVNGQSFLPNVTSVTLHSNYLGYDKKINIYVPSAAYQTYNPQYGNTFNVVYLLDGNIESKLFDLVVANFAYMNLDLFHNYPPFIVVGIDSDIHRTKEFTPMTTDSATINRALFKKMGFGNADAYLNFLEKELFPYIRQHYPVSGHRIGIGHSLGGTLLMYALDSNKKLFNAYFLFSPNLHYGNGQLIKNFEKKYPAHSDINRFFYVSVGDIGYENYFKPSIHLLDSLVRVRNYVNFPFVYDTLSNCDHLFSPQRSLPLVLEAYKKLYQPPSTLLMKQFLTEKGGFLNQIKNFYNQKDRLLGYGYLPGIEMINEFVSYLLMNHNEKQALKVVNRGIQLYPENYYTYLLYLKKAQVLKKKNDRVGAINACLNGIETLNETKGKMDYGGYLHARHLLTQELEKLKKE